MLESILQNIINMVDQVFLDAEPTSSIIAIIVALIAGFAMSSYSRVFVTTLGAVVALGVVNVVRHGMMMENNFVAAVNQSFSSLLDMPFGVFLVYFVAFFIVISVVFMIRTMFLK